MTAIACVCWTMHIHMLLAVVAPGFVVAPPVVASTSSSAFESELLPWIEEGIKEAGLSRLLRHGPLLSGEYAHIIENCISLRNCPIIWARCRCQCLSQKSLQALSAEID